MKRKATVVGIHGDEPTLLPGEGGTLSSRMAEQENPLCFQPDARKTRRDTQPCCIGLWGLFSPSVFAYFSCSLLSTMPLCPFCPSSRSP